MAAEPAFKAAKAPIKLRARRSPLLLISLLLAGCVSGAAPNDIGTQLYSGDTIRNTELLELYVGAMCKQAGLPLAVQNPPYACDYARMGTDQWNAFVEMGIFDIDQKCDTYLRWLTNGRRSREVILKQFADTGSFTREILSTTSPAAVAIVGAAFGFVTNSFTNFGTGLLDKMETSTVISIVSFRQEQLKSEVRKLNFPNKPAALNAVRAYMRVCMPHNIEADINASVTASSRGADVSRPLYDITDSVRGPVTADTIVFEPPRPPPPTDPRYAELFADYDQRQYSTATFRLVQAGLCAPVDGRVGPVTIALAALWKETQTTPPPSAGVKLNFADVGLITAASCPSPFKNVFERQTFVNPNEPDSNGVQQVRVAFMKVNIALPDPFVIDSETRQRIALARAAAEMNPTAAARIKPLPAELRDSVTPDLISGLMRIP